VDPAAAAWLDRAVERRVRCLVVAAVAAAALALPSGASAAPGKCRGTTAAKHQHHKAKPARRCRAQSKHEGSRGTDRGSYAPAVIETWGPATPPDAVLEV